MRCLEMVLFLEASLTVKFLGKAILSLIPQFYFYNLNRNPLCSEADC